MKEGEKSDPFKKYFVLLSEFVKSHVNPKNSEELLLMAHSLRVMYELIKDELDTRV